MDRYCLFSGGYLNTFTEKPKKLKTYCDLRIILFYLVKKQVLFYIKHQIIDISANKCYSSDIHIYMSVGFKGLKFKSALNVYYQNPEIFKEWVFDQVVNMGIELLA